MITYREHRGTLKDSIATTKEYDSLVDLYDEIGFHAIKYYGSDTRVNQELFMVLKNGNPLGFICE